MALLRHDLGTLGKPRSAAPKEDAPKITHGLEPSIFGFLSTSIVLYR